VTVRATHASHAGFPRAILGIFGESQEVQPGATRKAFAMRFECVRVTRYRCIASSALIVGSVQFGQVGEFFLRIPRACARQPQILLAQQSALPQSRIAVQGTQARPI